MKIVCSTATAVLFLSATHAMGQSQSLEQTFDQLGSKLEAAQQSLVQPKPGTTIHVWGDTPVFTKPDTNAVTPLKLDANAPVIFQGVEKGFVRITPQTSPGTIFYVPQTAINAPGFTFTDVSSGISGAVNNQIKNAMETLKGIARDLQQNPYVRMKGFSVNVSISPSLNIDFEMRDAAPTSSPTGTIKP
jgi:hypothetical protein